MHNVHDHRHDQRSHRYVLPLELVDRLLRLQTSGAHHARPTPHSRGKPHDSSAERLTAPIVIVGPAPAAHVARRSYQQVRAQPDTHRGLFRICQSFSIIPCQVRVGSALEQPSRSSDVTARTTRTTLLSIRYPATGHLLNNTMLASSSRSRSADGGAASFRII